MDFDFARLAAVFAAVFLAELGDKTQVATVVFASDRALSPLLVFVAASSALVASSAVAVLLGATAGRYLEAVPLRLIAGIVFIVLGAWYVVEHLRGA